MFLKVSLVVLASYLIGSLPIGWMIVKLFNGKDVREIGSGRVGGTNVMRAAGFLAGLLTAAGDFGKGILAGVIATAVLPGSLWMKIVAVVMAVVGQIFSVFLIERLPDGKFNLRGGAGGSTTLGGAVALAPYCWVIILPLILLVYLGIGYASVTTISIAFFSLIYFGYEAVAGLGPWEFIFYGVITLMIVLIALRPNLKRLAEGTERAVGFRALRQKRMNQQ